MKKSLLFSLFVCFTSSIFAQWPYMKAIPNGANKKAIITEQVGLTDITLTYHRPSVNGREGKIWGNVVHKGFINQGFGTNNPAPWRAGANENTTIEFNNDIKVEGKLLTKGKYALYVAYDSLECIVIFSKKYDNWGSFFYDEKDDVLRIKVKPRLLEKSVEWLRYEFYNQTQNSAEITIEFEKLAIPFKVEVDYLQQQFDAISGELKNPSGFTWESLNKGAAWCLQNNYQLEQGLAWSKNGTDNFGGNNSFNAINTTVQLLNKLGRKDEASQEIKKAIAIGNMNELHQYGRQLLQEKKSIEALEIFELNLKKNPNQFTTLIGITRGLSAIGNYKKALSYATMALPLSPNEANKTTVQNMIISLEQGKDIN
jgi:tetratricopeptide (TPR) repeat protein